MTDRVGQGGFAVVFKRQINGQWRAVKEYRDPVYKDYHLNESLVLSNLEHPNIVKYFGTLELGIVMELMSHNLCFVLHDFNRRDEFPLSSERQWHWALQLTDGLDYMHQKGYIHRDIKSLNVLVSQDLNLLKWCDFELCLNIKNPDHELVGTRIYWAPELREEEGYSFESDIFALGCVFYEIFTREMIDGSEIEEDKMEAIADKRAQRLILDCLDEKSKRPLTGQLLLRLRSEE